MPLFRADGDREVRALPLASAGPVEREDNRASERESVRRQICGMDAYTGVPRVHIIRGLPVILAPVHQGRREQRNAQILTSGNGAALIVVAPLMNPSRALLDLVTAH